MSNALTLISEPLEPRKMLTYGELKPGQRFRFTGNDVSKRKLKTGFVCEDQWVWVTGLSGDTPVILLDDDGNDIETEPVVTTFRELEVMTPFKWVDLTHCVDLAYMRLNSCQFLCISAGTSGSPVDGGQYRGRAVIPLGQPFKLQGGE